jgi:hypothetical protein
MMLLWHTEDADYRIIYKEWGYLETGNIGVIKGNVDAQMNTVNGTLVTTKWEVCNGHGSGM